MKTPDEVANIKRPRIDHHNPRVLTELLFFESAPNTKRMIAITRNPIINGTLSMDDFPDLLYLKYGT